MIIKKLKKKYNKYKTNIIKLALENKTTGFII